MISNHPRFRRVLSPSSSSFVRHTQTDAGALCGSPSARSSRPSVISADRHADRWEKASCGARDPTQSLQPFTARQPLAGGSRVESLRMPAARGGEREKKTKKKHTEIFLFLIAIICLQRENNIYIYFFISYLSDNRLYNIIHKKIWDKFSYISPACINTVSYNDMGFFDAT